MNNFSFTLSKEEKLSLNLLAYNFSRSLPKGCRMFVIDKELSPTKIENTYSPGSMKFSTDVRPVIGTDGEVLRLDIINNNDGHYTHNVVLYKDNDYNPRISKNDTNLIYTVSEIGTKLEVFFVDYRGLLTVQCDFDHDVDEDRDKKGKKLILSVLGVVQTPKPFTSTISCDNTQILASAADKQKIREGIIGYMDANLFIIKKPYVDQSSKEKMILNPEACKVLLAATESTSEYAQDAIDDDEFDDILGQSLFNETPKSDYRYDYYQEWGDDEDGSEVSDDYGEDMTNDGSETVSSSILRENASNHNYTKRDRTVFDRRVYTISLVEGLKSEYKTDNKRTAISKLLADVDNLNGFERFWCLSILDVSLRGDMGRQEM